MKRRDKKRGRLREERWHYRDTLKVVKEYFSPQEPNPEFSRRLEEFCETLGAEELFRLEQLSRAEGTGRRGMIIGGAVFSALPFIGVAAYAIRKHLLRRRVVPMGV